MDSTTMNMNMFFQMMGASRAPTTLNEFSECVQGPLFETVSNTAQAISQKVASFFWNEEKSSLTFPGAVALGCSIAAYPISLLAGICLSSSGNLDMATDKVKEQWNGLNGAQKTVIVASACAFTLIVSAVPLKMAAACSLGHLIVRQMQTDYPSFFARESTRVTG